VFLPSSFFCGEAGSSFRFLVLSERSPAREGNKLNQQGILKMNTNETQIKQCHPFQLDTKSPTNTPNVQPGDEKLDLSTNETPRPKHHKGARSYSGMLSASYCNKGLTDK
jgi:hypothetical protein